MKNGFTLLESLVVIGLVGIISMTGLFSTLRSNEQKKVFESAETIRQYFVQTKAFALSGRKDCAACGAVGGICGNNDTPLVGWRANLNNGNPVSLEIHGECGNSAPYTNFFSTGNKTMPNRIVVNQSANVVFLPLNKGTNLANTITVTVSSNLTGLTSKSFTISPAGEISALF